jgi:parallel beta-helix repeat protein
MRTRTTPLLASLLLLAACQDVTQPVTVPTDSEVQVTLTAARTIQVAPPTGTWETDRTNIEAAIRAAKAGDVIQFAPGEYALIPNDPANWYIAVDVPHVTLQGHPAGTTLVGLEEPGDPYPRPRGLMLSRPGQTVRNLEFTGFYIAVDAGRFIGNGVGGFLIEGSTFRNSAFGVAAVTLSGESTQIVNNEFVNVGIPFWFSGRNARMSGNRISAPEPERVQFFGQPWISAFISNQYGRCEDNVIEDNLVDGFADGFFIYVWSDVRHGCRGNVIRNNQITNQRVFTESDWGTLAWLWTDDGVLRDNVISGNTLEESEGIGIITQDAVRTRIENNTIRNVRRHSLADPVEEPWSGVGVALFGGSQNQVLTNTFSGNESCDVLLLSDRANASKFGFSTGFSGEGVKVSEECVERNFGAGVGRGLSALWRSEVLHEWVVFSWRMQERWIRVYRWLSTSLR